VIIGGEAARSCVIPVGAVGDAAVVTLDGLAIGGRPHPVQAAFIAAQAAQCGYCTSGMIMAAKAFLDHNRDPDEAAIRSGISNLCRCGAHNRIVRAVRMAAQALGHRAPP
jgi:nicotinate dehydrogenase subunit A